MNRTRKLFVFSSILLSILVIKCDYDIKNDCSSVMCTMEFRSITVLIKHRTDSTYYKLTDYRVNRVSDNMDITVNQTNISDYSGYYPVVDDTKKDLFINRVVEVEFKGYLNDAIIIQKRFLVTADCCHISLVEGDTKFYI